MKFFSERTNLFTKYEDVGQFSEQINDFLPKVLRILGSSDLLVKSFSVLFNVLELSDKKIHNFGDKHFNKISECLGDLQNYSENLVKNVFNTVTNGLNENCILKLSKEKLTQIDINELRDSAELKRHNWNNFQYQRLRSITELSKSLDGFSLDTKVHCLQNLQAKEKIYVDMNIDIDDQVIFNKNKYFFFIHNREVFTTDSISFKNVKIYNERKNDEGLHYFVDNSNNFCKISDKSINLVCTSGYLKSKTKRSFELIDSELSQIRSIDQNATKRYQYFIDMKRKGIFINTRFKRVLYNIRKPKKFTYLPNYCCSPICYSKCGRYIFYYEKVNKRLYCYSNILRKNVVFHPISAPARAISYDPQTSILAMSTNMKDQVLYNFIHKASNDFEDTKNYKFELLGYRENLSNTSIMDQNFIELKLPEKQVVLLAKDSDDILQILTLPELFTIYKYQLKNKDFAFMGGKLNSNMKMLEYTKADYSKENQLRLVFISFEKLMITDISQAD